VTKTKNPLRHGGAKTKKKSYIGVEILIKTKHQGGPGKVQPVVFKRKKICIPKQTLTKGRKKQLTELIKGLSFRGMR